MDYSANSLKNQYEKDCLKCRTENLIRLREKIAEMTQTQFSEKIGIQKTNLNSLEKGSRDMSLFNIQAYKTFFKENYGIDVSVDYLLGYTSVMENRSMNISNDLGLSGDSIEMLKILINFKSKYNDFIPALGTDIDVINILLEYEYNKAQKAGECIASWSIFHYIRQYLSSGIYEREQQDNIRVCDGKIWFDLKKGDILIREKKEHIITDMEARNSESGGGSNTKKLDVINTKNPNERYNVEVNKMFQSYSRDNILTELDKIKTYIEKKKSSRKDKPIK